jgi:hypothetical protein
VWYDKFRKCRSVTRPPPVQSPFTDAHSLSDGNFHEGHLELITWPCPKEGTGWGNCFTEEEADYKRKFEVEFRGDLEKFYGYWPQGFRWTCCGMEGNMDYGCDHHGAGKAPCTCDFCR